MRKTELTPWNQILSIPIITVIKSFALVEIDFYMKMFDISSGALISPRAKNF